MRPTSGSASVRAARAVQSCGHASRVHTPGPKASTGWKGMDAKGGSFCVTMLAVGVVIGVRPAGASAFISVAG